MVSASAPSIVSALSASKPADAVGVAVLSDQQDADEDTSSRPGLQMGTHPMLSPIEVDTPTIERARHGVKGDVEDNECFDPIFYTNLVAMRQHDQAQRPQTATQAEEMFEQAEVEVNVVARMVSKRDVRARITVHQTTYLGSGAFSGEHRGAKPFQHTLRRLPRHGAAQDQEGGPEVRRGHQEDLAGRVARGPADRGAPSLRPPQPGEAPLLLRVRASPEQRDNVVAAHGGGSVYCGPRAGQVHRAQPDHAAGVHQSK